MVRLNYFKELIIIFGFIFLPLVIHLNGFNFGQYSKQDLIEIFLTHSFILIIIFILSFFIFFFTKKKLVFTNFLITNFAIFFFLFFYENLKNSKVTIISNITNIPLDYFVLLFFFILYLFIFFFLKNFKREANNFFLFFLLINFIYGFYNFNVFSYYKKNTTQNTNSFNLNEIITPEISKSANVYMIILDGMMNLERAESENIIKSSKQFHNKLIENDYIYNKFFKSNYNATQVSIKSLLYSDYILTEKSKISLDRKKYFPHFMNNKENDFYQIVNNLNLNLFWIGNEWGFCDQKQTKFFNICKYQFKANANKQLHKYLLKIKKLYENHLFKKFSDNYLSKNTSFVSAYNFLRRPDDFKNRTNLNLKKNFYLIHVMKPHDPFNLDENCNEITNETISVNNGHFDNTKKNYSHNYSCVFNTFIDWDNSISLNKDKDIVIVLGDHGWSFKNKKNDNELNLYINDLVNNVFYTYKVPKRCKTIKQPNSHVNVMRFIFKCLEASSQNYLDDAQYYVKSEEGKYYSRAFRIKE